MDKNTLLQRLSDIEWSDFEVKKASSELPKDVWETVSAFSNTSGGWLVLGVSQNGTCAERGRSKTFEVTGVANPEKIEQDLTTTLRSRNKFNVLINPECKKYTIDGKTVLAFYIPSSELKPVYFNTLQNTFIRTGSGDHRATDYEINVLLREQSFGIMSEKPVEGTSINSFNKASYRSFRDYLERMVPESPYNKLQDDEFNEKLQLVKNGKLTYGGLLFLGDNLQIQNHVSDFRIDYLEIPATSYADAEPRYTFRIQEQENIWEYYFALFQRLRIYADNPLYIGDMGGGYEDTKQLDALREALINMLMHCDYFSPMKPRIRVFTNRIEFENPGKLPRPIEELMKVDVSILRNPVLAKLFRAAKLSENAGYGFDKMLVWEKETHKEVIFETFIDSTKVTFMLKDGKVDIANTEKPQEKGAENNQKTTRKQPENNQKTTRKQPEVRRCILELMKSNAAISRSEMANQIGISESSVRHHLETMKNNNIIRREGSDKGGKWIIINH